MTRLVIVSGGSRGLGAALCDVWQGQGCRVMELSRASPRAGSVKVDLSHPEAACDALRVALADVDTAGLREVIVVANAGVLDPIGPASQQPTSALVANLQVNLVASIAWVAKAVGMLQTVSARKLVIAISSGAASKPHAGLSLYGAAKAGMEQFIRTLALEQAREAHPFTAITVDPGALDTAMQLTLRSAPPTVFPEAADFAQRHQSGTLRSPQDAAAAIAAFAQSAELVSGSRYRV